MASTETGGPAGGGRRGMNYEAVIGLEVHVQLLTRSKLFCACPNIFGREPNTLVCPVCLGYPGAMPALNREAVRLTVLAGLMLNCEIPEVSKFDRKNYFYPDMPKNYQISQYDQPLCQGGWVDIEVGGKPKRIPLTRIHLEEDVGKNTHFGASSGVDFNRAGTPLMEIVSEPAMADADEAFAFLQALKQILVYGGVSACNLEEGNMRCDINCSVRPVGQAALGVKAEIKNMNTFKGVHHALSYEILRQKDTLAKGGVIVQETRRWDDAAGVTLSMRTKEYAHDYRYFPEPDLMPTRLTVDQIEAWRAELPELPQARHARFVKEYGLPDYDAGVLVADKAVADYFEDVARRSKLFKAASNWMMTEMMRALTESGREISTAKIAPEALAELIRMVDAGTINSTAAKTVFQVLFEEGGDPKAVVEARGLAQVSDRGELDAWVDKAIAENPQSVEAYRGGKAAALQHLMGQVMRMSRGKANPPMVLSLLKSRLGGE
jgi:aspartyl-tRNA(Asn)/glutamyl-tRNA(Gln) amidotransferase subunit B